MGHPLAQDCGALAVKNMICGFGEEGQKPNAYKQIKL
jgi:hypothetical protein